MRAAPQGALACLAFAVGGSLGAQPRPAEPAAEEPVVARGKWIVSEPSTVTVSPDGTAHITVHVPDAQTVCWATLVLAQKVTATGATVRVKCDGKALIHLGFHDVDETTAYVPVIGVEGVAQPDVDGWRAVSVGFAQLDNRGQGNFVMEELNRFTVSVGGTQESGVTVQVQVGPVQLAVGPPVRMRNAPPGDAALQPLSAQSITGTEEGDGAAWQPWNGATVALDQETVQEGRTSVRLGVRVTDLEGQGSGGNVSVIPPEGAQWLGDRLIFWCFPRDVAFLPVIINDRDGTQISKVLKAPDLVVGQWNRVEIRFADAIYSGTGDRQLGEVGSVVFVPHTSWDHERAFLTQAGEYVWYLDGLHLEGEGPVELRTASAIAQPPAAAGGLTWMPVKDVTVAGDEAAAHEGEPGACLTATIGQVEGEGSGGQIIMAPPEGETWLGDRLVFWCLPKDVPFLPVIVNDKDGTQVARALTERDLRVGEWNRVEIPFGQARQAWGAQDLEFGAVGSVLLLPYTAWDMGHRYLKEPGEYTWYIADLHVEGQGPVDLGGAPVGQFGQLGLEAAWSVQGDCVLGAEPTTEAARLAIALTLDPQSGGTASARPPDGKPWPAGGIRFRCLADTVPYLVVQAVDADGSAAIWYLSGDDLQRRQWTDVELRADGMMNVGAGDNTLDNIAGLSFSCYGNCDPQRTTLPKEGEVVWLLDDLSLIEEGPAALVPRPAPAGSPEALRDDTGDDLDWSWAGRGYAEPAADTVHDGARSIKLSLPPRRTGQPGYGNVVADLGQPRRAEGVRFWLWPAQSRPLTLYASDQQNHAAVWTVGEGRLAPGEWSLVELRLAEAEIRDTRVRSQAVGPEDFGPVYRLSFGMGADQADDGPERFWYVDSLELIQEGGPCGGGWGSR